MLNELIKPKAFSKLHDSFFLTTGKTLYVAQDFENLCRSFANLIDVKRALYAGEISLGHESFDRLFESLQKRMLGGAVKLFASVPNMPNEVESILTKAKTARNFIAHNSSLLINDPSGDEETIWSALGILYPNVKSLLPAHAFLAACLYWQNEKEELIIPSSYESDILRWVFSEFSDDDYSQLASCEG